MVFGDDRPPETFGKAAQLHMKKGEVVRLVTGTGGGYGDSLDRPIRSVIEDVKNGMVTPEIADKSYGVVVEEGTLELVAVSDERKSRETT